MQPGGNTSVSDRPWELPDRDASPPEAGSFDAVEPRGSDDNLAVYELYCRAAARVGYRVEVHSSEAMSDDAQGETDIAGRRILLNATLTPLERVTTLGHELAHVFAARSVHFFADQPAPVHHYAQEIAAELVSQIVSRGLGSGEMPDRLMEYATEGLRAIGRAELVGQKGYELIMFAHALLVAVDAGGALVACLLEDPEPLESGPARRARRRRENPR